MEPSKQRKTAEMLPRVTSRLWMSFRPTRSRFGGPVSQRRTPAVRQWLAAEPRLHLHFTPTSASWLNLIERCFALATGRAILHGSFDSMGRLERAIMRWLAHWNEHASFSVRPSPPLTLNLTSWRYCYLRDRTLGEL
jgi:hypothetical protein